MRFTDVSVARDEHYSLGVVDGTDRHYLSIPVSNGLADYEEYYEIDDATFTRFLADPDDAAAFAAECRRHEHDDRLILQPGWNRGTPI